jgi:RNA recognition motif-containing protein
MASEGKKVYIGGLTDTCTKEDLQAHFGRYGKVATVWIARNPPGFAFVTYEEAADATEAVRVSDGEEFQGRTIRVEVSKSEGRRGGRRDRRSNSARRDERRDDYRRDDEYRRDDYRRDDYRRDDYRRDDYRREDSRRDDYRRDDTRRDEYRRDEMDTRRDDRHRRSSRSRSRGRY